MCHAQPRPCAGSGYAPTPHPFRQLFAPAVVRGVVAKLVAGLGKGRHAEVGPVGPDGSSWGGAKWGGAKWGGAKWGGSSWGGSSWGGIIVGRLLLGRLLVGRLVLGRLLVGRLVVGRLLLGRRLSRARPGLEAT